MLVHYDGSRVKLSAEYSKKETDNSVQQSLQPINQQSTSKLTTGNTGDNAAAGSPPAQNPYVSSTPQIRNPTLERFGITMPQPQPPTTSSVKLTSAGRTVVASAMEIRDIYNSPKLTTGPRSTLETAAQKSPVLTQTLKHRDFYDSPYMTAQDAARLKLKAPQETRASNFDRSIYGGIGAAAGAAIPLMFGGGGVSKLLASTALGGLGYLAGDKLHQSNLKDKLRAYRYHLETQN
jgi:hypothetical protein